MELSIRNAKIEDSKSIAELSHQLGYEANITDTQFRLNEILENDDHCIYVGIIDGELIGWVHGFYSLRVESDSFVEIGGLIVNNNYQKQGIGKKLVNEAIKWSKSKKCEMIRVRCNEIRKESHKFYENIGFELKKEQKVFNKKLEKNYSKQYMTL